MTRVYVVEDQPTHRDLIREILGMDETIQPTFFTDGVDAYLKIQQEPPDFLITDIIVPSLSGLAICRLLKFHDEFRKIPIMVISSIGGEDVKANAAKAGADLFMSKPFSVVNFLNNVQNLVETYRQMKARQSAGAAPDSE